MQGQRCAAVRKSCLRRQIPRCASFKFLPTRPHPPSRHSARAPRPCLSLLLARPRFPPLSCTPAHPSSRSADAIAFALSEFPRISARPVPAPRTTPSKSAPARSPLPHARTPRPVPLAPPSLDPHARALQLGPRVPNHPRSDPPPHMPTHLGPSLFPSSPRLPERATRRRRRRNCEPGPAYSQLGGGATPPWSGAGSYGAGRSSNCPPPVTTFTVVVVAAAARGCQSAATPGFTGNESSPLPNPPPPPPLPVPPARTGSRARSRNLGALGSRKLCTLDAKCTGRPKT